MAVAGGVVARVGGRRDGYPLIPACHRGQRPRVRGGTWLAWGVSPRNRLAKHRPSPRRGRKTPRGDGCGSRCSPNLSPLRGSIIIGFSLPGAHAPGYASSAAPRLTSPRLAMIEYLGFHLRHSWATSSNSGRAKRSNETPLGGDGGNRWSPGRRGLGPGSGARRRADR